ncbi:MAG TPA: L-histidine N(alpha)-methyltransferase, partial [Thermoanaerobaculia bacterium]
MLETASRILVTVRSREGQAARDREELRLSLLRTPPEIPSRLFYDDRGSELFEHITELPEYYQTRTERALLEANADRIVAASAACELIEIGSGAATKTRLLLDALQRAGRLRRYVPIDVSEGTVRRVADELAAEYPDLAVHGIVGDFTTDFAADLERREPGARRLVIFLGGTIGNLHPDAALDLLATLHRNLQPGDCFLLGVDRVKPVARLEAAYNDAQGITALFNLNILNVVNRQTGGDFDLASFGHRAFYDPQHERIEMRLVALREQRVHL